MSTPRSIAFFIFGLALVLRLLLLLEAADSPYATTLMLDAEEYQHLAHAVLDGSWRAAAAQTYVHGILFPLLWALVIWVAGWVGAGATGALWSLLVLQAGLGALTCVLLYEAARHLLGPTPAVICGVLSALYWPFLVFGTQPLATTLVVFLVAALLAWQSRPAAGSRSSLIVTGLLLALLGATRANALLLFPVIAGLLVQRCHLEGKPWRRPLLHLCLAVAVGLTPFFLHNLSTQGTLLPFEGAWSMYMGNNPAADGTPYARQGLDWQRLESIGYRDGLAATPAQRGRVYLTESIAFWTEQPQQALQLTYRKFRLFWHAYEVPVSIDLDWYGNHTLLGRALPVTFGLLAPLALLGMGLNLRRGRQLLLPYGGVAAFLLSGMLFTVCARYRLPALPFLLLFAADGGHRLALLVRDRRPRPLLLPLVGLLLAGLLVHTGVDASQVNHLRSSWLQGEILLRENRLAEARASFEQARTDHPQDADVHNSLAAAHEREGRLTEAEAGYRKALQLAPDHSRAAVNLARLLGRRGRLQEAGKIVTGALAADPRPRMQHEGLLCRGTVHMQAGNMPAAYDDMHAALRIMDGAQGRYSLANVCHQLGRIDEEIDHLEQAVRLQPDFAPAHLNLGTLRLMQGDAEAAEQSLKRAIALEPNMATAHANLGMLYQRTGRPDLARAALNLARRLRGER